MRTFVCVRACVHVCVCVGGGLRRGRGLRICVGVVGGGGACVSGRGGGVFVAAVVRFFRGFVVVVFCFCFCFS